MEAKLFTAAVIQQELNEVTAIYRKNPKVQQIQVQNSEDIPPIARQFWPVDINHREAMIVIYLNNSNTTIGYSVLSIGGITGTVVDIRLLFQSALLTSATAIIACHNHPSGTLQPSQADKEITNKIKQAGEFLDIRLLDHLIITEDGYFSFADQGLLS